MHSSIEYVKVLVYITSTSNPNALMHHNYNIIPSLKYYFLPKE